MDCHILNVPRGAHPISTVEYNEDVLKEKLGKRDGGSIQF